MNLFNILRGADMPTNTDPTTFLARLISGETLILVFGGVLGLYGTFAALADDQEEQAHQISNLQFESQKTREAVQNIRTDVAIILNEQAHVKEDMATQKDDIKRIRVLLERAYGPTTVSPLP